MKTRLRHGLITFIVIATMLCQEMAFAKGPGVLTPRSKVAEIAKHLPPDLREVWNRFTEDPNSLTPQELGRLKRFLIDNPQLPDSARIIFNGLLGGKGLGVVQSHRFRKDLREALEEALREEGFEEGRIGQILNRGLSWTDGTQIFLENEDVFRIVAGVLNRVLRKKRNEQVTPEQVKAVAEYHEMVHIVLRKNRSIINKVNNALKGKTREKLFKYFSNQYGQYRTDERLVEELIAGYYTEKILINSLEVLDDNGELVTIEDIDSRISEIIETYTQESIDRMDTKKLRFRSVLEELSEFRRRKKIQPEPLKEIVVEPKKVEPPEELPEMEVEAAEPDDVVIKLEAMSNEEMLALAENNYGLISRMARILGVDNNALVNYLEEKGLINEMMNIRERKILELARRCRGVIREMAKVVGMTEEYFKDFLKRREYLEEVMGIYYSNFEPISIGELKIGSEIMVKDLESKGLGKVIDFKPSDKGDIVVVLFSGDKTPIYILRSFLVERAMEFVERREIGSLDKVLSALKALFGTDSIEEIMRCIKDGRISLEELSLLVNAFSDTDIPKEDIVEFMNKLGLDEAYSGRHIGIWRRLPIHIHRRFIERLLMELGKLKVAIGEGGGGEILKNLGATEPGERLISYLKGIRGKTEPRHLRSEIFLQSIGRIPKVLLHRFYIEYLFMSKKEGAGDLFSFMFEKLGFKIVKEEPSREEIEGFIKEGFEEGSFRNLRGTTIINIVYKEFNIKKKTPLHKEVARLVYTYIFFNVLKDLREKLDKELKRADTEKDKEIVKRDFLRRRLNFTSFARDYKGLIQTLLRYYESYRNIYEVNRDRIKEIMGFYLEYDEYIRGFRDTDYILKWLNGEVKDLPGGFYFYVGKGRLYALLERRGQGQWVLTISRLYDLKGKNYWMSFGQSEDGLNKYALIWETKEDEKLGANPIKKVLLVKDGVVLAEVWDGVRIGRSPIVMEGEVIEKSPESLWELAKRDRARDGRWRWNITARRAGIKREELIKIIILYLAEKFNGVVSDMAKMLEISEVSLMDNYLYKYGLKEDVGRIFISIREIEEKISEEFKKGEIQKINAHHAIKVLCASFGIKRDDPPRREVARLFFTYRFYEVLKEISKKIEEQTKGITSEREIKRIRRKELIILRSNKFKRVYRDIDARLLDYYGSYRAVYERNKEKIKEILSFWVDYDRDICGVKDSTNIIKWLKGEISQAPDGFNIHIGEGGIYTLIKSSDIYINLTQLSDLKGGDYWMSFEEAQNGMNKYILIWDSEELSGKEGALPLHKYQIVKDGIVFAQVWDGKPTGRIPIHLMKKEEPSILIRRFLLEDGDIPNGFEANVRGMGKGNASGMLTLCAFTDFSIYLLTYLYGLKGKNVWVTFEKDENGDKFAVVWESEKASLDKENPYGYLRKYYLVQDGEVLNQGGENRKRTGKGPIIYTWKDHLKVVVEGKEIRPEQLVRGEGIEFLVKRLFHPDPNIVNNVKAALGEWVNNEVGVKGLLGFMRPKDISQEGIALNRDILDVLESFVMNWQIVAEYLMAFQEYQDEKIRMRAIELRERLTRDHEVTDEVLETEIRNCPGIIWYGIKDMGRLNNLFSDLRKRNIPVERRHIFRIYYKIRFMDYLKRLNEEFKGLETQERKRKVCEKLCVKELAKTQYGLYHGINEFLGGYPVIFKDLKEEIKKIFGFEIDYKKDILQIGIDKISISSRQPLLDWICGISKDIPGGFYCKFRKGYGFILINTKDTNLTLTATLSNLKPDKEYWISFEEYKGDKISIVWEDEDSYTGNKNPIRRFYLVKDGVILAQKIDGEKAGRSPLVRQIIMVKNRALPITEVEQGMHNTFLLECLVDPYSDLAKEAMEALKRLKNEERLIDILRALDSMDWQGPVRERNRLLLDVLGEIGIMNEQVLQRVMQFCYSYPDPGVREKAQSIYEKSIKKKEVTPVAIQPEEEKGVDVDSLIRDIKSEAVLLTEDDIRERILNGLAKGDSIESLKKKILRLELIMQVVKVREILDELIEEHGIQYSERSGNFLVKTISEELPEVNVDKVIRPIVNRWIEREFEGGIILPLTISTSLFGMLGFVAILTWQNNPHLVYIKEIWEYLKLRIWEIKNRLGLVSGEGPSDMEEPSVTEPDMLREREDREMPLNKRSKPYKELKRLRDMMKRLLEAERASREMIEAIAQEMETLLAKYSNLDLKKHSLYKEFYEAKCTIENRLKRVEEVPKKPTKPKRRVWSEFIPGPEREMGMYLEGKFPPDEVEDIVKEGIRYIRLGVLKGGATVVQLAEYLTIMRKNNLTGERQKPVRLIYFKGALYRARDRDGGIVDCIPDLIVLKKGNVKEGGTGYEHLKKHFPGFGEMDKEEILDWLVKTIREGYLERYHIIKGKKGLVENIEFSLYRQEKGQVYKVVISDDWSIITFYPEYFQDYGLSESLDITPELALILMKYLTGRVPVKISEGLPEPGHIKDLIIGYYRDGRNKTRVQRLKRRIYYYPGTKTKDPFIGIWEHETRQMVLMDFNGRVFDVVSSNQLKGLHRKEITNSIHQADCYYLEKNEAGQRRIFWRGGDVIITSNPAVATPGMYTPKEHRKTNKKLRKDIQQDKFVEIQITKGSGIEMPEGLENRMEDVLAGLDDKTKEALEDIVIFLLPPENPKYPYYLSTVIKDGKLLDYQVAHAGSFQGKTRNVFMTIPLFLELPISTIAKILKREIRLAIDRYKERNEGEDVEKNIEMIISHLKSGGDPKEFIPEDHPIRRLLENNKERFIEYIQKKKEVLQKSGRGTDERLDGLKEEFFRNFVKEFDGLGNFSITVPELVGLWSIVLSILSLRMDERVYDYCITDRYNLARLLLLGYLLRYVDYKGLISDFCKSLFSESGDFRRFINSGKKESLLFLRRFRDVMNRILESTRIINYKVKDKLIEEISENFRGAFNVLKILIDLRVDKKISYMDFGISGGGYSGEVEEILAEVKMSEGVRKIYPELKERIRAIYPDWELISLSVLQDIIANGKLPEGWLSLVSAMRRDGIVDKDDFTKIKTIGEILEGITPGLDLNADIKTLITEAIAISCLKGKKRSGKGNRKVAGKFGKKILSLMALVDELLDLEAPEKRGTIRENMITALKEYGMDQDNAPLATSMVWHLLNLMGEDEGFMGKVIYSYSSLLEPGQIRKLIKHTKGKVFFYTDSKTKLPKDYKFLKDRLVDRGGFEKLIIEGGINVLMLNKKDMESMGIGESMVGRLIEDRFVVPIEGDRDVEDDILLGLEIIRNRGDIKEMPGLFQLLLIEAIKDYLKSNGESTAPIRIKAILDIKPPLFNMDEVENSYEEVRKIIISA